MLTSFDDLIERASLALAAKKILLVTAESCTGGLIAQLMTDRTGSSGVFERGYVTYSNDAKMECLDVPADTLMTHGAVSAETAIYMAKGALNRSHADIALSVTGIAGPGGGSADKPVGLVYIGLAQGEYSDAQKYHFTGSRHDIRIQTAEAALLLLLARLAV